MEGLALKFDIVELDEPRCVASVQVGDFSGAARYWMPSVVFADFAEALGRYPLGHNDPLEAEWYGGTLFVRIERIRHAGQLEVRVRVADPENEGAQCQIRFRTRQADLDRFRLELLAAISSGEGEAKLSEN